MTTAKIATAITKLTAEEKTGWDYFLDLHRRNGWIGDDAYRKAGATQGKNITVLRRCKRVLEVIIYRASRRMLNFALAKSSCNKTRDGLTATGTRYTIPTSPV